ncbi:hypothetical protein SK128_016074 [Halocaridina rubra]|uniref:Uncharacterized protein n=1 Tax=Halocaridina rubra TaxID=373956 RepID=A0AAN8WFZ6_HALRR
MENVAYENTSVSGVPANEPDVQNSTNSSRISCKCEEENRMCDCKCAKSSQWQIESHTWSKIKGYMLIGTVAVLVIWCAVYFTLLGLDYV